jgi:hypothetical protein
MASSQAADPFLLALLRKNGEGSEISYGRVLLTSVVGYVVLRLIQARFIIKIFRIEITDQLTSR